MAYVYRHIRLDNGQPFYIGIGADDKGKYIRANTKWSRNRYWQNIIKKTPYEVEIMFENEDVEVIKKKEIEFIKLYGRKDLGEGILINMTDGGDGAFNTKCSEETREKLRIANRGEKNPMWGKKMSEENKIKARNRFKGIKRPNMSGPNNVNFGKKNPEHSLRLKGRKYPERSEMFKGEKNPNYGKTHSEEIRLKISEKLKGKFVKEKNPMWGKRRLDLSKSNVELKGKKVINIETGQIYKSIAEASIENNIGIGFLKRRLSGQVKNNTNLIFLRND